MTPVTDEQLMRAALADLTDDQPPMPPGRFQAVRRRAIRHRKRQLTGALVSALAVVRPCRRVDAAARDLARAAAGPPRARLGAAVARLPERQRSAIGAEQCGAGVARGCRGRDRAPLRLSPARGRPAGQILPRDLVRGAEGRRRPGCLRHFRGHQPGHRPPVLVVGSASASDVLQGQPAWISGFSPWALTTTAAPANPSSFGPDISQYLPETSASGVGMDTWIVVLPKPGALLGSWSAAASGSSSITAIKSSGLFAADAGQIELGRRPGFRRSGGLSCPGRHRQARCGSAPRTAASASVASIVQFISSMTGQGSEPSARGHERGCFWRALRGVGQLLQRPPLTVTG